MHVSSVTAASRVVAESGCGEALGDAGLQLGVATRRKQELGGHPASIVLGAAGFGARLGIGASDGKGRQRQNGQ
jgi:hypothetical protein